MCKLQADCSYHACHLSVSNVCLLIHDTHTYIHTSAHVQTSGSLVIPNMPCGRIIRMCIESTWGDKHYVGLSGIEIFDERGEPIVIEDPSSQVCSV